MQIEEIPNFSAIEQAALGFARQHRALVDLCVEIQQIPAPTGAEGPRADRVEAEFRRLGLSEIYRDELENVGVRIPGLRSDRTLLVSAHTDTVFPPETDLSVRVDSARGLLAGPGIGDNSVGVAALLGLAETLVALPSPPVDIWLVANSNEEGLGDLRGMRAVVDRLQPTLGAAIVLEGMGLGRIVHRALGVRRYRIGATAPGGHSWGDFGSASAIHALVTLAAELTRMAIPQEPRSSYNIGRIGGGRSVNTIAQEAHLELDLRSVSPDTLAWLEGQVHDLVERQRRSHRRHRRQVSIEIESIGDRPGGGIPADHPMVQALSAVLKRVGVDEQPEIRISSTDANVPLSMGIPAVCIGLTRGGDAHRLSEWIDPAPLVKGMQQLLHLAWWTAAWLTTTESACS